jgi:hypothetical protein
MLSWEFDIWDCVILRSGDSVLKAMIAYKQIAKSQNLYISNEKVAVKLFAS